MFLGLLCVAVGVWLGIKGLPGTSSLSSAELVSLKNRGLAYVENAPNVPSNDGTEGLKIFAELVREAPGAMLGVRNLAVAGVVAVDTQYKDRDKALEKYEVTLQLAREALKSLRAKDPDSGVVDMLEGKLHVTLEDKEAAAQFFRAAYDKNPDDAMALMELFSLVRNGQSEQRESVIRQAAAVNPDNLIVLENIVRLQAESKDAGIVETLGSAVEILAPYKSILAEQKIDVATELPELSAAIESGDDAAWGKVKIRMIQIFNVVKQDFGYHTDLIQLQRHPLEYLIHDFPEGYLDDAEQTAALPEGITVSYSPFDAMTGLEQLTGVLDAQICDFDLDHQLDLVVLQDGKLSVLQHDGDLQQWEVTHTVEIASGLNRVLAVDFDRDTMTTEPAFSDFDFLLYGESGLQVVENVLPKGEEQRSLVVSEIAFQQSGVTGVKSAAVTDIENDGDLDVALLSDQGLQLWKNHENWLFSNVTEAALPETANASSSLVLAVADFNRSLQPDLVVSGGVFQNIRHGRLQWNESSSDLIGAAKPTSLCLMDVDNNGTTDVITADGSVIQGVLTGNDPGGKVWKQDSFTIAGQGTSLLPVDYDNDGWRDLVIWSPMGIQLARNLSDGQFGDPGAIEGVSGVISNVDVDDIDDDGDLDLLVVVDGKVVLLSNEGGNANNWIKVRFCAEPDPQLKVQRCNVHGVGARVDLRSAAGYQTQQADGGVVHFGVGASQGADTVRALWTNGIPQNLVEPKSRLTFTEQQYLLRGSCPYLYTWTGEKYEFFTDLLWAAPIGLQFGEGIKAPTREWEYLLIPGERLVPVDGQYRMQITEELWEAAYFDLVELIAVDHPADTVVFSNEKVGPPSVSEFKVHSFQRERLRPLDRVVASNGEDVTETVSKRDGRFTKLFDSRHKQGLVDEYFMELELGDLTNAQQVQLVMNGWMFPTDTSINIALSQNEKLSGPRPPYISMPRSAADRQTVWEEVVPNMGFPGGKTKTIVVEVPVSEFKDGDYRVRIASSMEIYWDEILIAVDAQAGEPLLQTAKLQSADLHYRGFSARLPRLNNGPERYVYDEVTRDMIWPPMAGKFTRYGDTSELITSEDNKLVVLGSGDEMTVVFEQLPPVRAGWKRDFLIHSVGWDKDADLNTVAGHRVEPLPFSAMEQYPPLNFGAVSNPEYKRYLEEYQTREMDFSQFWNLNLQ